MKRFLQTTIAAIAILVLAAPSALAFTIPIINIDDTISSIQARRAEVALQFISIREHIASLFTGGDTDSDQPDGSDTSEGGDETEETPEPGPTPTLSFEAGPSQPVAGIVSASDEPQLMNAVEFSATDDAFTVNALTVSVDSALADAISSVRVVFSTEDGTDQSDATLNPQNKATFTGLDVFVPADEASEVLVYALFHTGADVVSGAEGSVDFDATGQFVSLSVTEGIVDSTPTNSQGTVTNQVSIPGPDMIVRGSQPTIVLEELPTTVLGEGEMVVSTFTVTADSSGPVSLHKLTWDFLVDDVVFAIEPFSIGSFELFDAADDSQPLVVENVVSSRVNNTGKLAYSLNDEFIIPAGGEKTLVLKAQVSGAEPGDSAMFELVESHEERITGSAEYAGVHGDFVWSDMSGANHDLDNSTDWTNGYEVFGLPLGPHVLSLQ